MQKHLFQKMSEPFSTNRLKGNPLQAAGAATLVFFVGFSGVTLFSSSAEYFQLTFSPANWQWGILIASPVLFGSLLRIPFSAWANTNGGKTPMLVLLGCSILGMFGLQWLVSHPLAVARVDFFYVFLLGCLCGCGIATFSVGITQTSFWFPLRKQGQALGIYAGIGNLAPSVFSFFLPYSFRIGGFAETYVFWLLFLCVGTSAYLLLGTDAWYFQLRHRGLPPQQARDMARFRFGQEIFPEERFMESVIHSAKLPKTWLLVAIYFTTFGGFIALTLWLPTYWRNHFGLTPVQAGWLTALYALLVALFRILGGIWADRIGGTVSLRIALLIMLLSTLLLSFSNLIIFSVLTTIFLGISMGIGNAAVFKLVPSVSAHLLGGIAGWVGGLGALGGFLILPVMGTLASLKSDNEFANGFIILMMLSLFSLLALKKFENQSGRFVQPVPTALGILARKNPNFTVR